MKAKENTTILKALFHEVYYRDTAIEPEIVNEIEHTLITNELKTTSTIDEVKCTLKKMKKYMAPGISGLTTDMIKNLPEEGFKLPTS